MLEISSSEFSGISCFIHVAFIHNCYLVSDKRRSCTYMAKTEFLLYPLDVIFIQQTPDMPQFVLKVIKASFDPPLYKKLKFPPK